MAFVERLGNVRLKMELILQRGHGFCASRRRAEPSDSEKN